MIPSDIVEEILRSISIVQIISQDISLKKAGHNYKGFCPFHNDKNNPSFSVSDDKGLYHCFSCGAGGNALTFMKEYHKLDFIDAIKTLGTYAGIDVEEYLKNNKDTLPLRNILKEIHVIAQEYFLSQLSNFKDLGTRFAIHTIKNRKLDKNTIIRFGIGYGGSERAGLYQFLINKDFNITDILESGLCGKTETGTIYDRFRNRITFPISDQDGIIVAFGGRAIDSKAPAKYINSPETMLFKKGHFLYGWNLAKETVYETGVVIVVEGYIDVIRMFQAGFSNSVAPLGTGLTEDRISFLKNKVDTMILCLDGDDAGRKSAYRSAGIAAKIGVNTSVVELPEKEDPDTFLLTQGPNALASLIEKSISGEDFVIKSAEKLLPNTQQFLQTIFEYTIFLEGSGVSNTLSIATEEFLKKISEKIRISFSSIELEFRKYKDLYFKYQKSETFSNNHDHIEKMSSEHLLAEEILALLIMFPEFLDSIASIVIPEDFPTEQMQNLYKEFLFYPERSSNEWIIIAGKTPYINHTSKFILAPDMRVIKNYAVGLKINSLKTQRKHISKLLMETKPNTDYNLLLSKKIVEIQNNIISLKNDLYYL
ncbi:MAG: DNA primase [Brevinema sp.]